MPNEEYWKNRMQNVEQKNHNKGIAFTSHVDRQFKIAERNISKQIDYWYSRIAQNNEISMSDAKELLNKDELEDFHMSVEEYIKKGKALDFDNRWMQQLENASAKVHIRRLEALQIQMQQECEVLFGNMTDGLDKMLTDIYTSTYYNTAYEFMRGHGVGWAFNKLDTRKIEQAINTAWAYDEKTFKARCWTNKKKLVNELNTTLTQSIIRGESSQKTIESLSKRMKVSRYNAGRLIMTESCAISTMAQKGCYKELGVEKFEFVATLDSSTSDTCRDMDGKIFDMADYKIGVNVPPLHCFCRSCTVPYYEDDFGSIGERAARGEDGKTYYVPDKMTYKQWQKSFVEGDKTGLQESVPDDKIILNSYNAQLQMPSDEADSLDTWVSNLEGEEQQKWIKAFTKTEYEVIPSDSKEISHFDPNTGIVHLEKTESALNTIHETAHAIDNTVINKVVTETYGDYSFDVPINSASRNVQYLAEPTKASDIESIAKKLGVSVSNGWFDNPDDVFEGFMKYAKNVLKKYPNDEAGFSLVSDIISGMTEDLTGGSIRYGGHSNEYWLRAITGDDAYMVNVEAWADFCALKVSRNENMLSVLKDTAPGMYDALEKTYKEVFG